MSLPPGELNLKQALKRPAVTLALATLFVSGTAFTGCSSEAPAAAASTAGRAVNTAAAAVAPADTVPAVPRSVFDSSSKVRDPFFPKSKRTAAPEIAAVVQIPTNIPALLQENFQGTVVSGDQRIAVINNRILEPGREVVIPLPVGGKNLEAKVRCLDVQRSAVTLQIQGHSQPVTLTQLPRLRK